MHKSDINIDMTKSNYNNYRIPSSSALIAFECAARKLNFSLAAEELNTSQSAISRHIQSIESRFQTSLFDRNNRKHNRLSLTQAGEQYYRTVVSGLDALHNASQALSQVNETDQLMIACTHESTHLYLMPRYDALQAELGVDVQIQIITSEYEALESAPDSRIDLSLKFSSTEGQLESAVLISKEAIIPVCSPAYLRQNQALLSQSMANWSELCFLNLTKPSRAGSDWSDWGHMFDHYDLKEFTPKFLPYYNYVYLLEAAAAGKGIGLGWRNLIERHLDDGMLITLTEEYVEFDKGLFGILSDKGRQNPLAIECLNFLASCT
jgi:LysR family glycine cleavage system transcriptional activator